MTSTFDISLTTKTAHQIGADLCVLAGGVGSAAAGMWAAAGLRIATVDAARNLDALAARSAG